MDEHHPPTAGLSKARIENLVDSVVSIAMTLLVLDLQPPLAEAVNEHHSLASKLTDLGPALFSYGISFLALAVIWIGHHLQFHFIRRSSRPFLWMNVLFLMFIAAVPFAAKLMARFPDERLAVGIYGGLMAVCGLFSTAIWLYATWQRRLVDHDLDAQVIRAACRRVMLAPASYLFALAFLVVSPKVTMALYLLVPLVFLLPNNHIDQSVKATTPTAGSGPVD